MIRLYDAKAGDMAMLKDIAYHCGSKSVKKSLGYVMRMRYFNPDLRIVLLDDWGFYAASFGKHHARLICIAVKSDHQRCCGGRVLMSDLVQQTRIRKLSAITLRCSMAEGAAAFYEKFGAIIVGTNGDDWEMKICLPE